MTALLDLMLAEATDEQLAALAVRLRPHLRDAEADARGEALLSPADAATRLGVHAKTLTRAARDGRVPGARRVGHGWRFDPATLDLLPVTHEVGPPPPSSRTRRSAPRKRGTSAAVDAIRGAEARR